MTSALASHFRDRRVAGGLSVGQLARLAGYRNISKGSKRIHDFERTGNVRPDLLATLACVLKVDDAAVHALIEKDRRLFLAQWAEWQAQPITPYVVVHLMPAWYSTVTVPAAATRLDSAEAFAASVAIDARREVCLVWSRRLSVYFDAFGKAMEAVESVPGGEHTPSLFMGRNHFLPGLGDVDWPRHPHRLGGGA